MQKNRHLSSSKLNLSISFSVWIPLLTEWETLKYLCDNNKWHRVYGYTFMFKTRSSFFCWFFFLLIRNYWNFPNPCEAVIFETVLDVLIKLVLFITRLDVVVWEKKILSAYFRNNSDLLPTLPPVRKLTAWHSPSKYTFKYTWNPSLSSTVLFSSRPPTSNLQIRTRVYL